MVTMLMVASAQDALAKHTKQRVLQAWHDVYMHRVMKRFQSARAQALFRAHVEQRALLCWQSYTRAKAHKATLLSTAVQFDRQVVRRLPG